MVLKPTHQVLASDLDLYMSRGFTLSKLVTVWLCLATGPVFGGVGFNEVVLPSAEGYLMTAKVYSGSKDRETAVIILHPFLATNGDKTVIALASALAAAGITVVAPNLSLGVPSRKQDLACEALHLHDMPSDLREIALWSSWLETSGSKQVYLVGVNFGGVQAIAYAEGYNPPSLKGVVAVSPVGIGECLGERRSAPLRHPDNLRMGIEGVRVYPLARCSEYPTTFDRFLSYAQWNSATILSAVSRSSIPTTAIIGGSDLRLPLAWDTDLRKAGADVVVVDGASHLYRGQAQTILVDAVVRLLAAGD